MNGAKFICDRYHGVYLAVSGETSLCPACYCQVVSYRAHECDVCGAEEGRPRVSSGGRVRAEVHAVRRQTAQLRV